MQELDLDHFQEVVIQRISESQYGDAMARIQSFTEQVIYDPESVGVVFASRELDALCERLADVYYRDRRREPDRAARGTVILASELVKAGGHVELIKDYLSLDLFERPVRVVLTDLFNRFDRATIGAWQSLLGCEIFVPEQARLDGKLDSIAARFGEWCPSTVVTMGHNQDTVCVVAAHAPGAANRYYVHHGDHHLSLGVTCKAFQHVDLHNVAYELCGTRIGVTRQLFWPISAVRPAEIKMRFLERGVLTTCSCGRMSKFQSGEYPVRYDRAVALILKASGGYHIHIGDLSDAFLETIYRELDAEHVSRDRFIHIEWVPSLSIALIENAVDVYVTSFPLGGGKASIEAMSVGIPVVVHESYRSRNHGGGDLVYPDSPMWTRYGELDGVFAQWDEALLRRHGELARRHFEQHYSKDAFMRAFVSGEDCAACVPPLRPYHGDALRNYIHIRRSRALAQVHAEAEKNRIFDEWKKVNAAYQEHVETVMKQQVQIVQLAEEKAALEISRARCRYQLVPVSWKARLKRLLGK